MARYVHAEYLLDKFEKVANDNKGINRQFAKGLREAIQIVIDAPSADVEPVVRGEWTKTGKGITERIVCSACGAEAPFFYGEYSYCPYCGAEIEGD